MVKHVKSELYIVVGTVAMSYLLHGKLSSNSSLCTFVVEEGEDHPRARLLHPGMPQVGQGTEMIRNQG